jgi:hypothetical protein
MGTHLFSRTRLTVAAACLVTAFSLPLAGQRIEMAQQRMPMFQDWSTRYVVYPRVGPMTAMQSAARDPRARVVWSKVLSPGAGGLLGRSVPLGGHVGAPFVAPWRDPSVQPGAMHRAWAIDLGAGGTAAAMYPAKFGFDLTAPPSCTNDYVVFPVDASGGATQPNIVAFNYLYSGTAGATGICNRTATGTDTGVAAKVLWSYNVEGIAGGGAVTTSPVISHDSVTPSACGTPTTSNDWLFVSVLQNRDPNIGLFNINSFPASATLAASTQEGSGASGMVVDNDSASGQASSIYFGALDTTAACGAGGTGGCAVKLTQATFQ